MGYGRAIAANTIWMIGGKTLTTALSLVLIAALARSLGVFQFGEYTTAFAFLSFFGVIADFGFFQILVREISRRPAEKEKIANHVFTLRTLFGIIIYAVAGGLVWIFPYSAEVKLGVVVLAAASFALSINTTLLAVFQAEHRMDKAVAGDIVSRALLLGLVLWALQAGWGLVPIFVLYLFANTLNLLITMGYLKRSLRLAFAYDPVFWRRLFVEAWPLGMMTMLSIIYFKIDTILISIQRSSTDVGIYGAPYKIFELLTIVPAIFMGNVFPVITRLVTVNDGERLKKVVQTSFDVMVILVVGIVFGLIILGNGIIGLVAGSEFISASTISVMGYPITAVQILGVLSLALFSIFLANIWSPIILALGKQKDLVLPGVIAVILNVVLNLVFIPRWSYVASALIAIVTQAFITLVWGRILYKYLPFRLSWTKFGQALIAGLIMALAIWPLRYQFVLIPVVVGMAVYGLALLALGALPKNIWSYVTLKSGLES